MFKDLIQTVGLPFGLEILKKTLKMTSQQCICPKNVV